MPKVGSELAWFCQMIRFCNVQLTKKLTKCLSLIVLFFKKKREIALKNSIWLEYASSLAVILTDVVYKQMSLKLNR